MESKITEENQNSITLKKDSKGNYNWDVKIYFNDNENDALTRIKTIDNKLREDYKNGL